MKLSSAHCCNVSLAMRAALAHSMWFLWAHNSVEAFIAPRTLLLPSSASVAGSRDSMTTRSSGDSRTDGALPEHMKLFSRRNTSSTGRRNKGGFPQYHYHQQRSHVVASTTGINGADTYYDQSQLKRADVALPPIENTVRPSEVI